MNQDSKVEVAAILSDLSDWWCRSATNDAELSLIVKRANQWLGKMEYHKQHFSEEGQEKK